MKKRFGTLSGRARTAGLLVLASWFSAPPSAAQGFKLAEDFEDLAHPAAGAQGPAALIARGWTFRNQSDPVAGPAWLPGGSPAWPYTGSGWLAATSTAAGTFGAKLSSWAILPPVAGQAPGDVLSFWVLGGGKPGTDTFLDVRYSPTGATGTGSGPFEVGDFTEVLFSGELNLGGDTNFIYAQVAVPLPGPGRVAIRFHAPAISNFQTVTLLWLDALTVGGTPPSPCGLTLPAAGQTVTWDASGSPYTICQDLVVPEGARLLLGPGVTVRVDPGRDLIVEGELHALGNASAPVAIDGDNVSGLHIGGSARLEHTNLDASVLLDDDATLEAFDSLLDQSAWLSIFGRGTFLRLERCEIRSQGFAIPGTSVLSNVRITNPSAYMAIGGFYDIRDFESVAPLVFDSNLQDRVIDNVTVTGVVGPALELRSTAGAASFRLGPNNVLIGNDYPVWTRFAGLTKDSVVPLGNVNDAVLGFQTVRADLRTRAGFPDLGVPYHFLERGTISGDVQIEPGAVLRFGPMGGMTVTADWSTDPILRGLPGKPIRFERLYPSQEWLSLATLFGLTLFEHLSIDGAGNGIVSNAELLLRDSTISNCSLGAHPASDGHIYGSGVQFLGNQIGLQNDTTHLASAIGTGIHFSGTERPNVFVGNVLAANNVPTTTGHIFEFPVDHNWWGHATGPFEPLVHPQGQGDPVHWVDFQPFLKEPPDLSDQRPVVRLVTRLHPAILPGEKIFIEWEAFDDGTIVEIDVQMLSPDINVPYQTYVDLVSDLPGTARRCELVIPDVGLHPYERFPFRIVARDDAGNVGFEQFQVMIPHQSPSGTVVFNTTFDGVRGGEDVTVCYDAVGLATSFPEFYMETASDDQMAREGPANVDSEKCGTVPVRIPYASTDRARVAIRGVDNFNREEWYFSDYFTIRPDPRIGDAPPRVRMTYPIDGDAFAGGDVLPIRWTASDDRGLREFRIQASFNGGYSFHTIAPSIRSDVREFDWHLPRSSGVSDLRVRVVAVDTLMQNTSDGDDRILKVYRARR